LVKIIIGIALLILGIYSLLDDIIDKSRGQKVKQFYNLIFGGTLLIIIGLLFILALI
jgi:uncharacterized membrane protein HdeD (DUF308 family)